MTNQAAPQWSGSSWVRRATVASTLAAGMAMATFPAPVFSIFAPLLVTDLGLSRAELGALPVIFSGVGAVGSPLAGRVVDRRGGRGVLVGLWLLAAVLAFWIAAARSVSWLFAAAVVAGIGQAAGNPATNRILAHHIPLGRRGMAMGTKQAGVFMGYVVGGLLLGPLAAAIGWRATLLWCGGVIALTAVLPLAVFTRDTGERDAPGGPAATGPLVYPTTVRRLTHYAVFMGIGCGPLVTYLPLYANEAAGWSVVAAGGLASALGLATVAGRIGWSVVAERSRRFGDLLALLAAVSAAGVVAIILAGAHLHPLLVVGAVAAGASGLAWTGVGLLAAIGHVGPEASGRASGRVMFGFLAGFTSSPLAFGALVDATGSYVAGWAAVAVAFTIALRLAVVYRRSETSATAPR